MRRVIKFMVPGNYLDKKIMFWHRLGRFFYLHNLNLLQVLCEHKIYRSYHCMISCQASIGRNLTLPHPVGIVIGKGVVIGDNVCIYQNVTLGKKEKDDSMYPVIEDNVTIYCNSVVLGNTVVRKGAVVGAKSLQLKDAAEDGVYVGTPAKKVR